jgi:hypothetical protein
LRLIPKVVLGMRWVEHPRARFLAKPAYEGVPRKPVPPVTRTRCVLQKPIDEGVPRFYTANQMEPNGDAVATIARRLNESAAVTNAMNNQASETRAMYP